MKGWVFGMNHREYFYGGKTILSDTVMVSTRN